MTVKRRKFFGNDRQALGVQIRAAAARLDRRKHKIAALAETVPSRIKSELVSPGGLWIAGSTGFLLAEWLQRPTTDASPADSSGPAPRRRVQIAEKSKLLLLLKFGMHLNALWAKADPAGTGASSGGQ